MKIERNQTIGEEIANSITHGLGALAGLIAGTVMILFAVNKSHPVLAITISVFVASVFILYLTSCVYHALPRNRSKAVFKVLDHSAIFLLIAGTYTPFALGILQGALGWLLFLMIWMVAIVGIVIKCTMRKQIPLLSNILYLGMGWVGVLFAAPLVEKLSNPSLMWLIAGGLTYTLGVFFFILDEKLKYAHFIWHIFVLLGTTCHFVSLFQFVL